MNKKRAAIYSKSIAFVETPIFSKKAAMAGAKRNTGGNQSVE
jgi:hypothetical protein